MHAVLQRRSWKGYNAYRVIAARIPIFWPILPLLYVWPIPEIGKYIYRRVADSRTCSLIKAEIPETKKRNFQVPIYSQALTVIVVSLIIGNSLLGLTERTAGWPLACYPTFSEISGPKVKILEVVPLSGTGALLTFDLKDFKKKMGPVKFNSLAKYVFYPTKNTKSTIEKELHVSSFWQAISSNYPTLQQVKSVQFYDTRLWSDPEKRSENPVARSLIYELKL
ncbi:hypothetical protein [Nostoc sp.]|uniref:hypothetical protein n=1 Tax=Nostoc sp. TaxID=1180 RepID=UPI003594519B